MSQINKLQLSEEQLNNIIDIALAEDTSHDDITSEALIPPDLYGRASILIKERGILAGGEVARMLFLRVDPALEVAVFIEDGARVKPGDVVATISGKLISILKAERTALNFLSRLSGIATATARYAEAIAGLPCHILDTRKTAPGLRLLDKYAVTVGGGKNHRLHLGNGVLIKDNHWTYLRHTGLNLKEGIQNIRSRASPFLKIEVEVENLEEAREAVEAGADVLMLDNMPLAEIQEIVAVAEGKSLLEVSGGITLDNVRQVAETGIDFISIGALTHSPQALDISLELVF